MISTDSNEAAAGDQQNHVYDVAIIGAGVSGLSCAKLLVHHSLDVVVLEATNRIGGRTWTVNNPQVQWVDLGGAYVGPSQNHLLRLIKDLGLQLYPVNEVEKLVHYDARSNKRTLFAHDQIPLINLFTLLDFNHVLQLLDRFSEEVPADEPWKAKHAHEWDQMTLKEFLHMHTISSKCRELVRNIMANIFTNEPYESSLLWVLWCVKQCHGIRSLISTTGGAQQYKVLGGTNQISERLATQIGGSERVFLQHAVCAVEQLSDLVVLSTVSGAKIHCRYLVMAIPPAVQQKIHYIPPLPPMRNQLIQHAPMGSILKFIVYYEQAFWRSNGMCGSSVIIGDDHKYPAPITFDDSKPNGSYPAIIGFIPADKARKVTLISKEKRMQIICSSLAKAFGCEQAKKPIHYEEHNWMQDQYCGGGYTMTCPPGFLTTFGPHLRTPIGRIHFAGTETATEWSGYINGAIQAGERAAREVLSQRGELPFVLVNQPEPESLEYPFVRYQPKLIERYAPSASTFLWALGFASFVSLSLLARPYCNSVRFNIRLPFLWKF